MFHRERPEIEYAYVFRTFHVQPSLYQKYGLGTTDFSAFAGGLLGGKDNEGIPFNSRFDTHATIQTRHQRQEKIRKLTKITEGLCPLTLSSDTSDVFLSCSELQTTITALSLAWVAKNPNTSTVILGVSSPQQIQENLKALSVIPKLTHEILERIENVLGNAPPISGTLLSIAKLTFS
ncbi:hypothetical protein H0H87_007242 [Tephrocybe sp. NHM501043]|nr:hypothetical protein H0H87_007242 [Tephrocybe sp. NHM501043]